MTAPAPWERLATGLWPEGDTPRTPQVFAVLDGARDRRIEPLLRLSGREYACLYAGRLVPRLAAAAPYVVHLALGDALTRTLLTDGVGSAWGVFAVGPPTASVTLLRRHFRGLLLVRDERGRRLVFRFYDPRVLAVYLRTATPAEARRFFGPVLRLLLADPSVAGPVVASAPGASAPDGPPPGATAPLVVRDGQMAEFRRDVERRFLEACLGHLCARFPETAARLGPGAAAAVGAAHARAAGYGLRGRREVAKFLALEFEFGPGFELAPGREWVEEVLSSPDIEAPSKLFRIERRRDLLVVPEVRHG